MKEMANILQNERVELLSDLKEPGIRKFLS